MVTAFADHDVTDRLVERLRARCPAVEVIRSRDVGLSRAPDEHVLSTAAKNGWVVLTHDIRTMPRAFAALLAAGARVPSAVLIPQSLPLGITLDHLQIVLESWPPELWRGAIIRLPLVNP